MARIATLSLLSLLAAMSLVTAIPVPVPSPVEQGDDVQINTYTTGSQIAADIASDAKGNFVVVWTSIEGDGDGPGIFGQRFDSLGDSSGSEFQVNTYTTGSQIRTAVAMDDSGSFVVVWCSFDQDGDAFGVFGQRFGSNGARAGAEFQVNTYTTEWQQNPDVAYTASGKFVVVWESYGQMVPGYRIYGQRFNSSGTPDGQEFPVSAFTTAGEQNPKVACSEAGFCVATWWDYNGVDGSGNGVFARRWTLSGSSVGTDFAVPSYTSGDQERPGVAVNDQGDFLISWVDRGLDGIGDSVQARLFDSAGSPVGSQFQMNSYAPGDQNAAAVAAGPNGEFVVVWETDYQDGSGNGLEGRLAGDPGIPLGSEFQVNQYTTGDQRVPAVAVDPAGIFTVVWQSNGFDGDGTAVVGRQFATHSPKYFAPGGPLDCSDPANPSTAPDFIWDGDTYDVFKVLMGSSPGFEKGTRVTSGDKAIKTTSWTPSKKKWKKACAKAVGQAIDPNNPLMYVAIYGIDKDLSKKDPAKKRFSPAVELDVTP